LYTDNVDHVSWNGMQSKVFTIENGVKQGGIVSPVLFVYILMVNWACYVNRTLAVSLKTPSWEHWLMLTILHCWLPHHELWGTFC